MTRAEAAAYLAAMIDGEGHIGLHVYHKNKGTSRSVIHRRLAISNTDVDIILACVECFGILEIDCWVTTSRHASRQNLACYTVNVSHHEGFERMAELPIRSTKKQNALREILESYVGTRRSSGFRGRTSVSSVSELLRQKVG